MFEENLEKQGQYRILILIIFFGVIFFLIFFRLYYLQVVKHKFFKEKLTSQVKKVINLYARRGNIYDRSGLLLVTTLDTYSVAVDGSQVEDKLASAKKLAAILSLNEKNILKSLDPSKNFIWIKRKVSDQEAEAIKQSRLVGVYLLPEQHRVYLRDYLAAQVLGFVDVDNNGLSGIEYSFDKLLQGISGKLIIDKDLSGKEIYSSRRVLMEPKPGSQLELTIDEFLQYVTRKELKKAVQNYQALGGTAVILNVKTSEILAMVSYPDFNPNIFNQYPQSSWRNDSIQTVYEPGSVFKIITIAAALDSGLVSTNYTFVNGNHFQYGGKTIREAHLLKDSEKERPLRNIIVESLNIGAAKVGLKIGKDVLYRYITNFYFGRKTGVQLLGESSGIIYPPLKWAKSDEAIIPFGQTIAVTPLQMVCALSAIANDGVYIKPIIIKRILNSEGMAIKDYTLHIKGNRIISKIVSDEMKTMLKDVVSEGTGLAARISGYSIGGKTGTSQKIDPIRGGYQSGHYISSFAGLLTVDNPRLAILVLIDTPRGRYYGGEVAAPVFKNIAEEAIRYLAIPPDM